MDDHTRPAVPERVARLGGYFALDTATGPGWRTFAELLDAPTLADRVGATRAAIADFSGCAAAEVPVRVAASSLQMAIAARLMSPALGSFAALHAVPVLAARSLRWRPAGHSVQFGATELEWRDARDAVAAAYAIDAALIGDALAPLIDRMHADVALSTQVMWGNVISSANGAVTVLGMTDRSLVSAGRRLVTALAGTARLRGTVATAGGAFRRRSCCLFYQAPHGGLCGDCVLHGADEPR